MIKVESIEWESATEIKVSLFADTKAEVPNDMASVEVIGLPENANIAMGSDVMTAKGEIAFRKSDETWQWV